MSGNGIFQSATNANQTFPRNGFTLSAAKSIRTSTIILAVFNIIAAFATAVGIIFDSYYRKKRNDRKFRFRYGYPSRNRPAQAGGLLRAVSHTPHRQHGFTFVPECEVYPLVLSFCIVVQSVTFAVAQSTGLEKLFGTGCTLLAQLMLPGKSGRNGGLGLDARRRC